MNNKKAFSLIEIIITISIIALLAVIGISSKKGYDDNMNNTKVVSDIETINNALMSFGEETKTLPMPGGNINFFGIDTSYKHSYDEPGTFGVYGSLTEDTIPKKYLDILPLDPRTHSYYSYGKVKENNEFEIASIQIIDSKPASKIVGNYIAADGPYNLIREYNGPNFVSDGSTVNFPYNPDELVLLVTTATGTIYREGDTITTGAAPLEIFFSDGSVSILEANSNITLNKLNFKGKDNLNTLVKIGLGAGTIWTRATKLNDDSEFEVYTTDTAAAVRGTIFGVSRNNLTNTTEVVVTEGEVLVTKINTTIPIRTINGGVLNSGESIKVYNLTDQGPSVITPITNFSIDLNGRDIDSSLIINDTLAISNDLITQVDPQNCTTFNYEQGRSECVNGDQSLTASGYTLVAYAPYDTIGDTNMYYKDNTINITSTGGTINSLENLNYISYNSIPLAQIGDVKGVNIRSNPKDFIKYSGLNLSGDFAIEMNLRGFNRTDIGPYNIFNMVGLNVEIYYGKLYVNNIIYSDLSYDSNFHKIIVKKEGTEIKAFIDGVNLITDTIDTVDTSILNIGNKFSYGEYRQQWNDIIDYVKIYSQ